MKKLHCIGIGGIAVSAIARYYLALWWRVSGSDIADSPLLHTLQPEGVRIHIGESAEHLDDDTDLVVYSEAIITKPDLSNEENLSANKELSKARKCAMQVRSYPEALAHILTHKHAIAITWSHGKSTTTAMLGTIFCSSGVWGSTLAGTLVPHFENKNIRIDTDSDNFAFEACEYKRSFLAYSPDITVITNIDLDHLDYYRDLDDYVSAFSELARQTGRYVIAHTSDDHARIIAEHHAGGVIVGADSYRFSGSSEIHPIPDFTLQIAGTHMRENARLAYVAAMLSGVKSDEAIKWLEAYRGSWRRGEVVGTTENGNILMSDYGHHPREIVPTLRAVRSQYPDRRLFVVFQPHQYSRTIELLDGFRTCFDGADELLVPDIYFSRDKQSDVEAMPAERFVSELSVRYPHVRCGHGLENTAKIISEYDRQNPDSSLFLLLGAGTVDNLRYEIPMYFSS